jgi:hypothetical protein
MKRFTFFLGALFFVALSSGQTLEGDGVVLSPIQEIYADADSLYASYFMQKTNPTSNKDELYQNLLDCFLNYCKCMDDIDEAHRATVKEKIRQLRPEFEMAGIHYSSTGDNRTAYLYLECYLNIPHLPIFDGERFNRNAQYSDYVFIVAAEAHNTRDYKKAVQFLQEYIELGEKRNQQTCYEILASDLDILERYDEEAVVLDEGIMNYPNSLKMIKQGILLANKRNNKDKAEEMLNKALAIAPNDPSLKVFKATIDDQNGRFAEALPVFQEIYEQNPSDKNIMKQLAFCHYNLAGVLINQSNSAADAEQFKTLKAEARDHFNKTITLLEPLSKLPEVVREDQRILYALSDAFTQVGRFADAESLREQSQQNITLDAAINNKQGTPNFNEWYKPRMDKILADWERRGEFESASKYQKRVNPETRKALIIKSRNDLEQEYIQEYYYTYNLDDLTIKPYDPDHETYRIQTRQGDIYLKVPNTENEAKKFKESWNGVKIQSPQFKIDKEGKLLLSKAFFVTPYGKSYVYDANEQLTYGRIRISRPEWNDDDLLATIDKEEAVPSFKIEDPSEEEAINVGESTVDVNIPKTKDVNKNTYALIIANENYKNVEAVPFAQKDGTSFMRYCKDVLGIPEDNIVYGFNTTRNEMIDAIDNIKTLQQVYDNMKLLVYYSGHGLPDPRTNESYLLPVDANPRNISTGYKLSEFYKQLTDNNPASVTVFLDACFSGTKKDGQIIDKEARGVIITPREESAKGNMVIFSACTGNETAYPYNNQKHGLFTYFLLKKLQEDKGKTSYKNLAEYISKNVKEQSYRINKKLQTPTTHSLLPQSEWGSWRLDK